MNTAQGSENQTAVVTGASSGIGKAAAKALAAMGWQVIGVGRNPGRSEKALAEIRSHAPEARVDMVVADLAIMADVRRAAREIGTLTDRVHVLLNNAGGIGKEKIVTAEGNEAVFAGNHLGGFLLTQELLPLIRKAASQSAPGTVRIVNVSSLATDLTPGLDWENLQMLRDHDPNRAYCNVKVANQMFTHELAKRLENDGIVVCAMHPGVVDTNFSSYASEETRKAGASMSHLAVPAEQGADTLVWLASDPAGAQMHGGYFYNREAIPMHAQARDDAQTARLWAESEAIIAGSRGITPVS